MHTTLKAQIQNNGHTEACSYSIYPQFSSNPYSPDGNGWIFSKAFTCTALPVVKDSG